jgi:hypothetical protein
MAMKDWLSSDRVIVLAVAHLHFWHEQATRNYHRGKEGCRQEAGEGSRARTRAKKKTASDKTPAKRKTSTKRKDPK